MINHRYILGYSYKLIQLTIMLTLAIVLSSCASGSGENDKQVLSTEDLARSGPYFVGSLTKHNVADDERNRKFNITVWYPAEVSEEAESAVPLAGLFPLIIDGHGGSSLAEWSSDRLRHLASYGFVVIAPDFPNTNARANNFDGNDAINQPGDISFIIDSATGLNNQLEQQLSQIIDPGRIGLSGLSMSAMTILLTSFDIDYKDDRIKAALVMAPAGGEFLLPSFYDNAALPFMLIHGTADGFSDYKTVGKTVFKNANSPSYFLTMEGGTHTGYTTFLFDLVSDLMGDLGIDNIDAIACEAASFIGDIETVIEEDTYYSSILARGEDYGMGDNFAPLPCSYKAEKLPGLSPIDQIFFTKLGILSFFKSTFSDSESEKASYRNYLLSTLPDENSEIMMQSK